MNRRLRTIVFGTFILCARNAYAQPQADPATSESLSHEGLDLRREGKDAEALAVFERALAIDSSPRTLAQVGLAEQALGLWAEAERTLQQALATGTDAWFAKHRDTLRGALDAVGARLATVQVDANAADAELWVNGARAGVLPLATPLRVPAGELTLEVRAQGFETVTRSVKAEPGGQLREAVVLTKQTSPVASTILPPDPADLPRSSSFDGRGEVGPSVERAGSGLRTGAWIAMGSAVVLGAGAGIATLIRNTNAADYNDDARCYFGMLTRDQRCGSYHDAASIAQTVALVEVGAAAAAAVVSALLFVRASNERREGARVAGCSLVGGVLCTGTF